MKIKISKPVPRKRTAASLAAWLKLLCLLLAVCAASTVKAQTNFASSEVIAGQWGSITNDNTGAAPSVGEPSIAGSPPNAPLWYQWTAPYSGVVEMDTIGSGNLVTNQVPAGLGTNGMTLFNTNISTVNLDTVLGVYTGSSLANLNQVAANANIFPISGTSFSLSSFYQSASVTLLTLAGSADAIGVPMTENQQLELFGGGMPTYDFVAPFYGPSGLRFNAVGGQTYYIGVDTTFASGTGPVRLNWAYQSSGVFRFATEDVDLWSGNLLYETSGMESEPIQGQNNAGESTVLTYYDYNAPGVLVTVTRVAGSTGRAIVNYETFDGTNLVLAPNDLPGLAEPILKTVITTNFFPAGCATNMVETTNSIFIPPAYEPVFGTLVFDDYEMSKTILIPIYPKFGVAGDQTNRVFGIRLIDDGGVTSPQLDPNESTTVSPPRVDPAFGTAMVRVLDPNADPYGPDMVSDVVTNFFFTPDTNTPGSCFTNFTYITNQVPALYPTNAIFNFEKANYRVPMDVNTPNVSPWPQVTLWVERFGTNTGGATINYRVNNVLGSDQESGEEQNNIFPLQPGSDYAVPTPPTWGVVRGTNSDFVMTEGTITFPAAPPANAPWEYEPITFTITNTPLTKFNRDFKVQIYQEVNNAPRLVGMINEATVTILFNDENPPAGSVDEFYNADFNSQMATYSSQVPITVPPNDPNPGVGLFGEVYALCMLTNDECLIGGDFQSYDGAQQSCVALVSTNGQLDTSFNPGSGANGAVDAVAASGKQFYLGGSFTAYNGTLVGGIARVNADGSIDASFNSSGVGADATVRAVTVLTNGEILIGGDFTHYNQASCNYIALLKTDGTIDASFAPGTTFNGPVYALALDNGGRRVLAGGNFTVAGQSQNIARLNLNGSVDATFNPGTGADNLVLTLSVQLEGQILVGGEFTHFNGVSQNRIARLLPSGALDTAGFFVGTGADAPVFCVNPMPVIAAVNYSTNTIVDTNTVPPTTNLVVITNDVYATGGIYVGGDFSSINGTHRLGFARLYTNGTVDTTFLDTAYNQFAGLKKIYSADAPAVLATAIQSDGNVLIGGSFNQVGGGQANTNVAETLDAELSSILGEDIVGSFGDPNLWVEPKTRDGVRNRSGLARLIGGATPGPGNLGFAASNFSVNKSQSALSVSLVRTNGILGPVAANFSVLAGTAQSGSDFAYNSTPPIFWVASDFLTHPTRDRGDGLSGLSGFLSDPFGLYLTLADLIVNQQSEVSVSVINDKSVSGNLDAQLQLANPSGADTFYLGGEEIPLGTSLGASSVPLTIVDDTSYAGTFGFSSSTYVATNLTPEITVVRSNGVYGVVTLDYSTANGTALAGTDYVGLTNKSMVFNQNQTTNQFAVTIKNDGYITNVEKTVNLRLFNLATTTGAAYGISNAVLRIINPNFQGFVTLGATNYTGAVTAGVLNFVVNRIAGSLGTVTILYATTNGTAVSGVDYIGATNTLTWNSGDVSPRVISIPLLNPGVVGPDKQFAVTLLDPTLNSAGAPSLFGLITNATLVITNNNSSGTLQFASPGYLVKENGGYATITVLRTGGDVGSISAEFATANGSAVQGSNYVATNGLVILAAGQTSASFNVGILNDGVADPTNFYFNVSLTGKNASGLTSTTIHIVDVQRYNLPPGTIDPSFNTNGVNGDVLTLVLQTNGQLVAGGNFTAFGPVPVGELARLNTDGTLDTTFLNGLAGANGAVNSLAVQTDSRILVGGAFTSLDGIRRNFIGRLMTDGTLDTSFNPGSGADNAVNTVVETFINGVRRVYVGGAFSSINGGSSPGIARLKADPSDQNNDGSVDSSFDIGSGFDGQVYAIAPYPTNSVYAGDVIVGGSFAHYNGVSATNLIRLKVDGSLDASFNANLGSGPNAPVQALALQSGGQVLVGGQFTSLDGTPINRVCRLNTDGTMDTNFLAALGAGVGDGSVAAIAVQPDNRILLVGGFAQVNGLIRNGITRLLPTGAADPTINFGSGANGSVNAVLVQPADGNLVIGGAFTEYDGSPAAGIARIYGGSVTGSGAFTFSSGNYQVGSDGVYAPIEILRTGGTSGTNADGSGDIFVQFTASGGTAVPGINYGPVSTYVDFPAGEVQETVLVPIFNQDVLAPLSWTVSLALTNATPPATNGVQPIATLTIVNANSAIAFSSGYYSVGKDTPTGYEAIDVYRLGNTNDTCSVDFSTTTNGTAVIGTDYYPTNGTITFLPGQTDIKFQVSIIDNTLVEGNRSVDLLLTNVVNSVLTSPSNAVLTIIDTVAAPGQLYFSSTNFSAIADQGTAYLTVLRTNGLSGTVSVTYNFFPGTALPGLNYVNTPGTLTFDPGVTSQTVPVQLVNSGVIQPPVTMSVALSNPTGGASLTGPTNTTLTIYNTNSVINFVLATNKVPENAGVVNVVVERYNNTNVVSTVQYATTNGVGIGAAIAGVNFSNTVGTLTFLPGASLASISIPLINQSNVMSLTFGVNLFHPVNGFVVAPSNTVIVLEGSEAGVSFVTNATTVFDNAGYLTVPVVCSNPLLEPVPTTNLAPLEVRFATVDGTAKAGIDYNATNGILVFTNGLGTNFFRVPILTPTALSSSNLSFSVILTNVTPPGRIAPYGTESVVIDESRAALEFSQPAYSVYKNAGIATITVDRFGYTNSTVSVDYSVTNGTAISGQNFYATNGVLVFTNGVTSQSFNVPIIANSQVQPNLFALLHLSNPSTNAQIIPPNLVTLTILENGGSYVVPAGALLVSSSSPTNFANDVIGSNDMVQVQFAFRDAAGLNVTNLVAYLQASNGVAAPSPASQTYGPLTAYGHSVSMPFTFTAHGTNALPISPLFQLYDNGKYIGPATFVFTMGTWTTTFANSNRIIIHDGAAATPYPSIIQVTNLGSTLVKATVTITNLSHQSFSDIVALLVSPTT
ncbi:MAG: Calx-beta domain-containing protein, partial [Verrucomicrobiota bacterium]